MTSTAVARRWGEPVDQESFIETDLSQALSGQSEFGKNADGEIRNQEEVLPAMGKAIPVISTGVNVMNLVEETPSDINRLFDGEATFDERLALQQDVWAWLISAIEGVEFFRAVGPEGIDLGYIIGGLAKVGIDGVYERFQPLQDLMGTILGNPGRIETTAEMWHAMNRSLRTLAEELCANTEYELAPHWSGRARDCALVRIDELVQTVNTGTDMCGLMGDLLTHTADLAGRLNARVRQYAADLVAMMVTSIMEYSKKGFPACLAPILIDAALITARGQLEIFGIIDQFTRVYIAAGELTSRMEQSLQETVELLDFLADPVDCRL